MVQGCAHVEQTLSSAEPVPVEQVATTQFPPVQGDCALLMLHKPKWGRCGGMLASASHSVTAMQLP
jgi:hypothetical protein